MKYLLDTNILMHLIRQDTIGKHIRKNYPLFDPANRAYISIVSIGEIESLAIQNRWGDSRKAALVSLLDNFIITDIKHPEMTSRYAEIDAFSQGKLPEKALPTSARNMGKNDLWIAATASVLGAKLLSSDADFDHLNGQFVDFERIA